MTEFIEYIAWLLWKLWLWKVRFLRYIYENLKRVANKNNKIYPIQSTYGFKILINSNCQWVSKELKQTGKWEPHISKYLEDHIKKGDVFFDLWANIGYFSLLSSTLVWTNWKVFAFEPIKKHFDQI